MIFSGTVYVAGGSGSGNAPVATVYRAVIQSDGMLGNWQALPSLPFARSYFGFGINGTSLYALGCDSGSVTPNDSSLSAKAISDVIYAEIDAHWESERGRLDGERKQAEEGRVQADGSRGRWGCLGHRRAV